MGMIHGGMIAEKLKANFMEMEPALTNYEAMEEANRCLYCYDAACIKACPTSIDIPKFIKKIASGNMKGSARTILEANPLGASCARVCPTEELCEGACVLNHQSSQSILAACSAMRQIGQWHRVYLYLKRIAAAEANCHRWIWSGWSSSCT